MRWVIASLWGILIVYLTAVTTFAEPLPNKMIYLSNSAPEISQDMRYASNNNFTTNIVSGYQAAQCILGKETAKALKKANTALRQQGYALQVLDCYRPVRAVKSFVKWVSRARGYNSQYHPRVRRSQLITKGYIGAKSTHSSGASVDLTLLKIEDRKSVIVDMGTPFDFFDPRSHTNSRKISAAARANRMRLVKIMTKYGFKNYKREWWHFNFRAEPLRKRRFDFVIENPN